MSSPWAGSFLFPVVFLSGTSTVLYVVLCASTWTGLRDLENVISCLFPGRNFTQVKRSLNNASLTMPLLWPTQVRVFSLLLANGLIPLEEWLRPGLYLRAYLSKIFLSAASWASPHTFAKFYRLDGTALTLVHTVIRVGSWGKTHLCDTLHRAVGCQDKLVWQYRGQYIP